MQTAHQIFTLDAHMMWTHERMCLLAFVDSVANLGGQIGGFQQMHQILKCSNYPYRNYHINHNQMLHSDRDHQVLSMRGPNIPQINPRWLMTVLKNRKTTIS